MHAGIDRRWFDRGGKILKVPWLGMRREGRVPSRRAIWIARAVAIIADALQLALFPIFGEGFASVANDALDVVVWVTLGSLIGWSPLFLPTFLVEMVPVGDLAPIWTIAVFMATRRRHVDRGPETSQLEPGDDGLR
jgi:hypothetical protein